MTEVNVMRDMIAEEKCKLRGAIDESFELNNSKKMPHRHLIGEAHLNERRQSYQSITEGSVAATKGPSTVR